MSADMKQGRFTFFVREANQEEPVSRNMKDRMRELVEKSTKIFIRDAAGDSLSALQAEMQKQHERMTGKKVVTKSVKPLPNRIAKKLDQKKTVVSRQNVKDGINLNEDVAKINRKRKLEFLMHGDPNKVEEELRKKRTKELTMSAATIADQNQIVKLQKHK